MHARIDQLLSIRDGEPVEAQVAAHVRACPRCAAELQGAMARRAALQSLPSLSPPDAWAHIQQRTSVARDASSWGRWAAVVAVLVLGALVVFGYERNAVVDLSEQTVAAIPASPEPEQLVSLVERSRALEDALSSLPQRPALERAGTAATIDGLQQRIEWLDHHLSYAHEAELSDAGTAQLWEERVALLDTLVRVRYAESGAYVF